MSAAAGFLPFRRDGLDPVGDLGRLRTEQPVSKLEFPGFSGWLVTSYAAVRAVLGDTLGFSIDSTQLTAPAAGHAPAPQHPDDLGFSDPPEHTRLRQLLTPEFTMGRLRRLTPRIRAIVDERLAAVETCGPGADLLTGFALPVPSLVICELLDVPQPDRVDFGRLSVDRFDPVGAAGGNPDPISQTLEYMTGLVARQREHPGDGLLGMLIREHGDRVTDRELAGLADGILVGGQETTASLVALGALVLLQNPYAAALIRQTDGTTHQIVEELLRYLTVVQAAFPRFARHDMTLSGQAVKAGDMVLCSLTAANRDPAFGTDMEMFRPTRPVMPHLAFGYGSHRCVGAELARIELHIALPALLRRFPTLRLAVPADHLTFRRYSMVHSVDSLPVTW